MELSGQQQKMSTDTVVRIFDAKNASVLALTPKCVMSCWERRTLSVSDSSSSPDLFRLQVFPLLYAKRNTGSESVKVELYCEPRAEIITTGS